MKNIEIKNIYEFDFSPSLYDTDWVYIYWIRDYYFMQDNKIKSVSSFCIDKYELKLHLLHMPF